MVIRPEEEADVAAIRSILLAAFPGPYEADLVDLLRGRSRTLLSLVAEVRGQIRGHILFTPATISGLSQPITIAALAPVAVLPQFQKQGIGSALIRRGLAWCREQGYGLSVVLGDPLYYARFGYVRASDIGLRNEYGVDDPFMVQSWLGKDSDDVRGLVRYAPEFDEVGA